MRVNEAPEKIYLSPITLEEVKKNVITRPTDSRDIEYTRTDAFIEKACEWLEPVLKNYAGYYVGEDILEDFKDYMKGE